jgi:NADPH:quinone reductase-like Zn-dependent oxidoreductase
MKAIRIHEFGGPEVMQLEEVACPAPAADEILVKGIHGAAGYVIGTASPYNFDFLKGIGADEAIDYKNQPFEHLAGNIDLVFNASPVRVTQLRIGRPC